ncbi:hypothetical protein GCM10009808_11960 [Microbacterium sediminicola]|uniref:NifU family protein n=1 Tax=Microbacterium sediminicola TaxID=415210 RepID=A0ABP4U0V8_9MICO
MTDTHDRSDIETALASLRDMLAADDYQLTWDLTPSSGVRVRIDAGASACADCLVPQQVMEAMTAQALTGTGLSLAELQMPSHPGSEA